MSKYNLGMVVGRFQPLTNGHKFMIDKALSFCKHVVIMICSAQESRTKQNPFSIDERIIMFKRVYRKEILFKRIIIIPVSDQGIGNNEKWGEFLLNTIKYKLKMKPDIFISGIENRRTNWFKNEINIDQLYINRDKFPISGTQVREDLFKYWKDNLITISLNFPVDDCLTPLYASGLPKKLWSYILSLAEIISISNNNNKTDSI